jgi:hypothetical protein
VLFGITATQFASMPFVLLGFGGLASALLFVFWMLRNIRRERQAESSAGEAA